MRRREFLGVLGGAAAAWPVVAGAQQQKLPVIGYFSSRSAETDVNMLAAFRRGLNDTGFIEGRNVGIEFRWGDGNLGHLASLANELVRLQVSVIVTSGGSTSALAAKAATTTIPIVFNSGLDPVQAGLVSSLNRPGGNLTGVFSVNGALEAKQLGLLHDLVPQVDMIGMLAAADLPLIETSIANAQAAARALGQELRVIRVANDGDIDAALGTLVQQRVGALVVGAGPFLQTRAPRIIALAERYKMPAIYPRREFPAAGGLASYGSAIVNEYRQLGIYTGRILKGEKPNDLPVMQATKFEFVINAATAKKLGLTISRDVMLVADEVIE